MCAASVASTVVCHVGGRERAGESLDGSWDPSIVNGPRSAKKKFMDLLKKVQKVCGPPMHFTLFRMSVDTSCDVLVYMTILWIFDFCIHE